MQIRASIAFDGVERAEADGPPTAFRIWRAGENITDHGAHLFSERSAAFILDQQASRGNRFSVDVNHLSLNKDAPLENQRAVGWFDVEVRDGELWAINCEWTDTVRAGLAKTPPEWRYHSPAYDVDRNTGEILGLTNLALTNNPATWSVTALATSGAGVGKQMKKMSWAALKAAIDGKDEDAKAAAYAQIAAAFPDEKEPDGDEKKEAEGEEPEKKEASEDEPEKKASEDEPEKKAAKATSDTAGILAALDAKVREQGAKLEAYAKKEEEKERAEILASREMSAELRKVLASKPLAFVKEIAATLPTKSTKTRVSTELVQATRGGTADDASRLPPEESKRLAERMGVRQKEHAIAWDPSMKTTRVFPVLAGAQSAKKEGN